MKSELNMGQAAGVELVRPAKPVADMLNAKGRFHVEHWRGGQKIAEYEMPNYITNEGRTRLLNVMFNSGTPITAWWMGLVDSTSFTAYSQGDSYAQIGGTNGWAENTSYTDDANSNSATTRPAWGAGSATVTGTSPTAVVTTTNASPAVFDITSGGNGTVKGLFIVGGAAGAQTKGDHAASAILWAAAAFTAGDVAVLSGDQLKVSYSVTA
jgi:hypothetical protein